MHAAFVIYDDMTALDLIGMFDPLSRLAGVAGYDWTWEFVALKPEVTATARLKFSADAVGASLAGYDVILIPGGYGSRVLQNDEKFLTWLQTAAPCPLKVSVCTGALLWGAAGFLRDKRATTHPSAYSLLEPYCTQISNERIVDAGDVITARGVTAAIDLGLYLCERLAGKSVKTKIQQQMDYIL